MEAFRSVSTCPQNGMIDARYLPDGVALNSDDVISLLEKWEDMYGNLELLRIRAVQGKLPIQSTLDAIRYLTTVDVTKIESFPAATN